MTTIVLPDSYPFATSVPKAGASCATCRFLGKGGATCTNEYYIREHGSPELGRKARRWCCNAWTQDK